ncbi:MAG: DUF1488 family protein [Bordetella sp.]|uniref:DUF1488 family protein n=1 Tax=Bordetella sp. TaxID=28081 RepID=UPI003F7C2CEB
MAHDPNAFYNPDRDIVQFRFTVAPDRDLLCYISTEALTDHFGCDRKPANLLRTYVENWKPIHEIVRKKLARGEEPAVHTEDL